MVFECLFRLCFGLLKLFLLLKERLYPGSELSALELSSLQSIIELPQPAVNLRYLSVEEFNPVTLIITSLGQLLIGKPDKLLKILFGKNVPLDPVNNKTLYPVLRKKRSFAQTSASPPGIPAHVVEEFS